MRRKLDNGMLLVILSHSSVVKETNSQWELQEFFLKIDFPQGKTVTNSMKKCALYSVSYMYFLKPTSFMPMTLSLNPQVLCL